MTQTMFLGAAAKRLGVPKHRLVYLLESGQVPEAKRLGERRVFSEQDLKRLAEFFAIKKNTQRREKDE